MDDAGESAGFCAKEAGSGDAELPAGGEREESDEWAVAGGAAGAAHPCGGDRGKDGGKPFGGIRPGDKRGEKHYFVEVYVEDGAGDGLQGGVRDCAGGREETGGFGGGPAVGGDCWGDDRDQGSGTSDQGTRTRRVCREL